MLSTDLRQAVQMASWVVNPEIKQQANALSRIPERQLTSVEKDILTIKEAQKKYTNLINITKAISYGGITTGRKGGLPRIALAPFIIDDGKHLLVKVDNNGDVRYHFDWHWGIDFPQVLQKVSGLKSLKYPLEGETVIPLTPLSLRPLAENKTCYVLFEVPEWTNVRTRVDPYVLLPIAGYIYAVLGSWDITELELKSYQAAREIGL